MTAGLTTKLGAIADNRDMHCTDQDGFLFLYREDSVTFQIDVIDVRAEGRERHGRAEAQAPIGRRQSEKVSISALRSPLFRRRAMIVVIAFNARLRMCRQQVHPVRVA